MLLCIQHASLSPQLQGNIIWCGLHTLFWIASSTYWTKPLDRAFRDVWIQAFQSTATSLQQKEIRRVPAATAMISEVVMQISFSLKTLIRGSNDTQQKMFWVQSSSGIGLFFPLVLVSISFVLGLCFFFILRWRWLSFGIACNSYMEQCKGVTCLFRMSSWLRM